MQVSVLLFFGKEERERKLVFCFLLRFLLQKTFAQHTVPKRSFLLGPKSRVRRLVVGVRKTPAHQETTITSETNTFTTIQKQSHPPVRIFASHQIKHTHPHRAAHFSLARGKKRRWFSPRKRGKKKNEKSQREQRRRRTKRERRFQPLHRAFNSTYSRSRENERI